MNEPVNFLLPNKLHRQNTPETMHSYYKPSQNSTNAARRIKENQSITEFDLYDLIQKDTHGYHDFVINKCFMGSIKLIKEGYDIHLSLKRLNYF